MGNLKTYSAPSSGGSNSIHSAIQRHLLPARSRSADGRAFLSLGEAVAGEQLKVGHHSLKIQ